VTASQIFDSLIAILWRFQSCAATESINRSVKRDSAHAKTCNLALASTIRRIIAEYVGGNSRPSSSLKQKSAAGIPMAN
jgi:hypothetical protein